MTIIYHSKDLDGIASGIIARLAYPDAHMIGYDYGEPIPEIPDGPVLMTDISFPMNVMKQIAETHELTWIDHHKTALADYESADFTIQHVHLLDGIAACELTWQYLNPEKSMPESVSLLGQYDTWRHFDTPYWHSEILPFQYGMRSVCNSIETFPVDVLSNALLINKVIESGKSVISYVEKLNESLCKSHNVRYPGQVPSST